jgi:hypothetical protein
VTVTVATSQPAIAIDQPASSSTVAQAFGITGWAIDLGAPVQDGLPGVDRVHIHAIANGGAGAAPAARAPRNVAPRALRLDVPRRSERESSAARRWRLLRDTVHQQRVWADGERAGAGVLPDQCLRAQHRVGAVAGADVLRDRAVSANGIQAVSSQS